MTTTSSRGTVRGLQPGTTYCFQVARTNGKARSRTYCHDTPTRRPSPGSLRVRIATFNVCGHVCDRWSARRAAVVRRIVDSKADVVTLQEVTRRIPDLTASLRGHGFRLVASTQNEAIFVRTSVFATGTPPVACPRVTTYASELDHPDWDRGHAYVVGEVAWRWDDLSNAWAGTSTDCSVVPPRRSRSETGAFKPCAGVSAAYAVLHDRISLRYFTVVTTHMAAGRSRAVANRRRLCTRPVMTAARVRGKGPVIVTGDMNSSRVRNGDGVGTALAAHGYVDAYQQSTSHKKAYVSSSGGLGAVPRRDVRDGDHIDRIFVGRSIGVSDWAVVAPLRDGRNVRPLASDHHPVRATIWLP